MSIGSKPLLLSDKQTPRRRHLYEGQTKTLFDGPEPGTFVLYFKDNCYRQVDTTITGKGVINNRLSEMFMTRLTDVGIANHFIKRLNMREQLVRATEALPFYVLMHNVATDDFATRLSLDNGAILPEALPEFLIKDSKKPNSILSERHLITLGWANEEEIEQIYALSQRINDFLCGQFLALGLRLINCKFEFGRIYLSEYIGDTEICLIDEISGDTFAALDIKSGQRYDIQGLTTASLEETDQRLIYQNLATRFGLLTDGGPIDLQVKNNNLSTISAKDSHQ